VGIGAGILVIAAGAILKFAVHVHTHGFNLHVIGVILMIAGAAAVLLDLIFFTPRRRRTVTTATPTMGTAGQTVVSQTHDYT
jgi:Domain of unknown function (DUF6458)